MNGRKSSAVEPPSRLTISMSASTPISRTGESKGKGRRGRLSHDDYARMVAGILRRAPLELEECDTLGQLPAVRRLSRRLEQAIFPTGTAIRLLLDRAAHEVETISQRQRDTLSQRVAVFLHIWYREQRTVVAVAEALGLSRSYVAHHIQPRALDLVARRFLELAWRAEAS